MRKANGNQHQVTVKGDELKEFQAFQERKKEAGKAQQEQLDLQRKMEQFNKKRIALEKEYDVQISIDGSKVYEALQVANQAVSRATGLLNQIQFGWIPKQEQNK